MNEMIKTGFLYPQAASRIQGKDITWANDRNWQYCLPPRYTLEVGDEDILHRWGTPPSSVRKRVFITEEKTASTNIDYQTLRSNHFPKKRNYHLVVKRQQRETSNKIITQRIPIQIATKPILTKNLIPFYNSCRIAHRHGMVVSGIF